MAAPRSASSPATFTLLGFPTRVRPGFVVFLVLLTFLYPFPLGIWVAGAVAVFTIIHELGHALAARRAGCKASISMDFMVAYAAYESPRPLPWTARIGIALAGPMAQIGTALAVLLALGVNPVSRADISSSEFVAALWWAGVALGAVNLVPLMPLDGGAVVSAIVERFWPENGRDIVLRASIAITAGLAGASIVAGFVGLLPLFVLMLLMQWQSLVVPRKVASLARDPRFTSGGDQDVDGAILAALTEQGDHAQVAAYAARAYAQCPSYNTAIAAAKAHLMLGNTGSALSWMQAAQRSSLTGEDVRRDVAEWSRGMGRTIGDPSLLQWLSQRG